MNNFFANLGINLVALVCVGIAGYMAINGKDGWGWFLFLGLCCAGSVTIKSSK